MSEVRHIEAKKIAQLAELKLNNFFDKMLAGELPMAGSNFAGVIIGRFQHGGFTYTAQLVVQREKDESCKTETGSKTS